MWSGIDRGDHRFRPRFVGVVHVWKDFGSGNGNLSPRAAELDEPQPIIDQPVGLGFPHRARRYVPGGSLYSSLVRRSVRAMEGLSTRGWGYFLPGWRWLHEIQPISDQPKGLGLPHRAGRYRPGGSRFSSPVCWSCLFEL